MNKIAIIRKMPNGKYRLMSKHKGKDGKHKNLGEYDTLEGAKERERQVEYFKHQPADDGAMFSLETKLYEIAHSLEKDGLKEQAEVVYKCINDIKNLNSEYLIDEGLPTAEFNVDNSAYIGGEGVAHSYSGLSVPESRVACTEKVIKFAGKVFDKFIKVVNNNGKQEIRAGYSKTNGKKTIEIAKNFNTIEEAENFINSEEMNNMDFFVNTNGLMGSTYVDNAAGNWGGILDPPIQYFVANSGDIGNWDFK